MPSGSSKNILITMYIKKALFFFVYIPVCLLSFSQSANKAERYKIAVFAPLYLDSAFDQANNYRYDKQFPKFINPGLEFYEGVLLALDSLNDEGARLEVFVYDTRSATQTIDEQLNKMDSVDLIIAYATVMENFTFASEARNRMIPYINPNLPNDGGVTNNPYFVLLNSTLKTHVEGIYRFVQKNYALNPVVVFRKNGMLEDLIKGYLDDFSKNTLSVPLKIKYVNLTDSFSVGQLLPHLDENLHLACIAGTLDEQFNKRLALQLASVYKTHKTTLIGMPTMENNSREFNKSEFRGPEIYYSTPFYNPRTDTVSKGIIHHFNTNFYARPSDMVMRGYETAWRFSKLLLKYKKDVASNLSKNEFNVFREFDIQPVFNTQTMTLDYFENKRLYFIKWQDGVMKGVY